MNQTVELESPVADPQAESDVRGIALDQVGISNVRYPVLIGGWELSSERQETKESLFSMQVSLAARNEIHMSRLLKTLHH